MEFWFDFASPYAYFASLEIETIAARHGRDVRWRPFLLGATFSITGMQPLSRTPLRGDYARLDWDRLARRRGVGFQLPTNHPALTVAPGRAFMWIEERYPDKGKTFGRLFFESYFAKGCDVSDVDTVLELAEASGVPSGALRVALTEPWLKNRFRQQTAEALARGVFGSPFFFVDGEAFWGADRIPMIDEWLATGGW